MRLARRPACPWHLLLEFQVEAIHHKAVRVCQFINHFGNGLAMPMPSLGVDMDQQRVRLLVGVPVGVLQLSNELERMAWHNTIIMVGRQQQYAGVLDVIAHHGRYVMQRRVPVQVIEHFFII